MRARYPAVFLALVLPAACARTSPPANASAPSRPAPAPASSPDPEPVVASPARAALLAPGDPVPSFRAVAHDGRAIDVSPQPRPDVLVVFFYPRDETPG